MAMTEDCRSHGTQVERDLERVGVVTDFEDSTP